MLPSKIQKMEKAQKKLSNIKLKTVEKYFRKLFLILLISLLSLLFFDLIQYFTDKTSYPWGYEDGGWTYENPINYLISSILIITYLGSLTFLLIKRFYKTFFILLLVWFLYLMAF
jgi:hypothetical protein